VPDLFSEPLADDLFVVYMFDNPSSAKAATLRDLASLSLDAKSGRSLAMENLHRQLGTPDEHVQALEPGQLGTFPPHFYASSMLFPPDAWAQVAARFGGELLVSVPTNDMLLYADGRHPLALAALMGVTQQTFESAERGITPLVFKWTPQGWVKAGPR
jgi:uncharacterized protein YtpQ (UPF0354 family)